MAPSSLTTILIVYICNLFRQKWNIKITQKIQKHAMYFYNRARDRHFKDKKIFTSSLIFSLFRTIIIIIIIIIQFSVLSSNSYNPLPTLNSRSKGTEGSEYIICILCIHVFASSFG